MTIERLRGLLSAIGTQLTARELAETLWLASHLTPETDEPAYSPGASTGLPPGSGNGAQKPVKPTGPKQRASGSPGRPRGELHFKAAPGGHAFDARAVLVPTAPMLHDVLTVQRALRPLKRSVPSSRKDSLDEDATAARIADQPPGRRAWIPVMRASPERWLSLALVLDTGPSMRMWRPLARELREALTRTGAFRDLRTYYLHGEEITTTRSGPRVKPAALLDPSGRQVILVLSDCSGPHWWTHQAGQVLHLWAQHELTAVLQPLPERLWRRTAAPAVPGLARTQRAAAPNAELAFKPHDTGAGQGVPVPVMEISPRWLADWARLVTGQSGNDLPVAAAYVSSRSQIRAEPMLGEHAAERVRRFRAIASPEAVRLAAYVAVSVPSLPVIRLIQHQLLQSPEPQYIAEVILSGLLRPVDAERGTYEFIDGARESLLATLPRSESWHAAHVLSRISEEIERRADTAAETFHAYLAVSEAEGDRSIGPERPFALVSQEAVHYLGRSAITPRPRDVSRGPHQVDEAPGGVAAPAPGARALEDLVVEVLHYWDDESRPGWSVGSGFLIRGAFVLTAAHNVGRGELLVRTGDAEWAATVRLRGNEESADLALLEITSDRIEVPRFRYGEVDRTVPGFLERCWAIGFPYYKERTAQPERKRLATHISGHIPTGKNLGLGHPQLLTLRVHGTPAAMRGGLVDQSEWSGMSGALVFADDIVVGVISEHRRPEGASSLAVVPITAVDLLPDAEDWWRLLGADRFGLVRLPETPLRDDGLYIWTAADSQAGLEIIADPGDVEPMEPGQPVDVTALRRGQLPNLQREFTRLGSVFDEWLASGPRRKRGMERLRVLWLVGAPGLERSKALLACLSRAGEQGHAVYDAARDLVLATGTLSRSILSPSFALPPLISIDLKQDQPVSQWRAVETAVTNARKQFFGRQGQHLRGDDPYPRMIVAGTVEQAAAAAGLLQGLVDIKSVDIRGHDHQRSAAFLEDQILTDDRVFNRGLPITASKLFGRAKEIAALRRGWESEQLRVLSVVAHGGTGKSALVNVWLHEMRESGYRGAQKVLAWSFNSHGTEENLVSADLFVSSALSWLGDDSAITLNSWSRGLRLASLIKEHRFLLVLDGLEPHQYPPQAPDVGGQLTDDSIRALLEELARPDWEGLCLVTTRVPLTDLSRFQGERAESADQGTVAQMNLENLDDHAGADLLRHLIRTEADFRDLQQAVREVDGHALAITMLGNYLKDVHGGDLAGRFDLERLTVDARLEGHARRIMASYERWLERHERFAHLTILRLIGLFDRPAAPDAMAALLADPRMRRLTGELEQGSDAWNSAVDALREMGLLNREIADWPGVLDASPLVREHFHDELRKDHEDWWLQGNRTLFDYYQGQAPALPSDSADMNTLYAAVTHGCAAGLYQQVFDDVLLPRVWRDRRTNFSTRRLGMIGSDLVALSNFFYPGQWTELRATSLSARARLLILTNAGVRLRQLGRLVDARDCFGAVVREIDPQVAQPEELEDATYAAAQCCELLVISGRLKGEADESDGALLYGKRAVEYSDRGRDPYFSMHARSSLAEAYFMLNDLERADSLFEEAKAIERERSPRPPFLYSQNLFRYGYFLIETGRAEMILTSGSQDPSWGTNGADSSLLSEAIRLLILGAAHRALIEGGNRSTAFLTTTEKILDDAISAFQTAGYADYTVRGLLERAHFYRALHNTRYYASTLADLARAAEEAQRGQMDLLYADVLLQQVACYLDIWPAMTTPERSSGRDRIKDDLYQATRLVTAIGYRRRQAMLASLQEAAHEAGVLA